MNLKRQILFFFCFLISITSYSQIRLPKLIGDSMILQRGIELKIWGWASAGEKVSVLFKDKTYKTVTDANGKWLVKLKKQKAGGPYDLKVSGSNEITIHDILIGDVWVCSGQSNMEMSMMNVASKFGDDIAQSENTFIREFAVPKKHFFNAEQEDLSGGAWKSANPKNVLRFSAAAYYFAKDLYNRYKIPIGIINATLGGSRAESWMSEEALKPFTNLYEDGVKYKDTAFVAKVMADDRKRAADWNTFLRETDEGYKDATGRWSSSSFDDKNWDDMKIPGFWTNDKLGAINGSVWFRRQFEIPASMAGKAVKLQLGNIVEADSVFVNDSLVGIGFSQYMPRNYNIRAGILKAGQNTIVVRVVSPAGKGGFVPQKEYAIVDGDQKIDLSGTWKYHLGRKMEPLQGPTFIQWKPTGLYKGMIAPISPYAIKGVLWYQGESNIGRHVEHLTLFPALINSWRAKWNEGDFPFLFVQLPNFNEAKKEPTEGGWASFRESQTAALSVPKTGMAVTVDVGEWNDIHPVNKKDVGIRLSLVAQHMVYKDKKIAYSGPVYKSMKIEGNKVILSFDNIGGGLVAKGGQLNHFAIAGADKKFVWANAEIQGKKIVVWSNTIINPTSVRYAWADNPEGANLYNTEGLPARPFRTDNF